MTNKLTPGASTGRATKLPAIPVVRTGNPEMDRFVQAVKEYIEVRDGVRGNPYDRFATMRDVSTSLDTANDVSDTTGLSLSDGSQVDSAISSAVSAETSKIRTELARTERNLRDTIAQLAATVNENALTSQAVQSLSGVNRYSREDLAGDLATGAANIVSGLAAGTTVMKLDPAGQYVVFQHKDASILGTVGAYTGTVRTALGITSGGILGGFNRLSDGAWQTSFAIESTTGNLTVLGTIKANSIIEVGARVGSSTGSTIGDLSTLATYAASEVSDKLSKTAADILSGPISFNSAGGFKTGSISIDSSGNATGAGVAFTSKGIVGRTASATTFTLDATTGNALFRGDIQTAGDATFQGQNPAAYTVNIAGVNRSLDYSCYALGFTSSPGKARVGHVGYSTSGSSLYNVGVVGIGDSVLSTIGIGVVGEGDAFGAFFSGNIGLSTFSTGVSNIALEIQGNGSFRWNNYNIPAPTGGTATFLRNDGSWATPPAPTSVANAANADALGGVTASSWARIFPTNSGTANAGGAGLNLLGSGATGIAGAYVGTSGSGNTVTFQVQASSPSDVRLKEEIEDTDLGLEFVNQLRPVSYKLKNDPKHQKGYGFIADEVEELIGLDSSLVYFEPDWKVGDVTGFKTVHYPSYIAVLTKAVQELSAKVETLQAEVTALKAAR
jgi:Chaperone of endosialidase